MKSEYVCHEGSRWIEDEESRALGKDQQQGMRENPITSQDLCHFMLKATGGNKPCPNFEAPQCTF